MDDSMSLADWLRAEAVWAKDALHDPERLLEAADVIEKLSLSETENDDASI